MTREMKDSGIEWIGQIPKDWEIIRLKDKYTFETGFTPDTKNSENYNDEFGYEWATISDIDNAKVKIPTNSLISREYINQHHLNQLPIGTLLYSFKLSVGQIAITDRPLFTNEAIAAFSNSKNECIDFLKYSSSLIEMNANINIYGAKLLNQQIIYNAPIVYPPLHKQHVISNYLDSKCSQMDSILTNLQDQIDTLEQYKKSVITEAVTKGLNSDVEMKDSGIENLGYIPEKWKCNKLLYVLIQPITDGPHETPILYEEGVPFVSAEAVSTGNGHINFNNIRGYISEEYYKICCRKYTPCINDIYMIKSGATTGKVAIVDTDEKFTIWSPLAAMRCDENKMLSKYLYYSLQSTYFQRQVELGWTYGTQQNIGMRTLEKLKVCYGDLNEQRQIVDYLDNKCSQIDSVISQKKEQMETLKEYKKSLIYEYVTGKKEVPNA